MLGTWTGHLLSHQATIPGTRLLPSPMFRPSQFLCPSFSRAAGLSSRLPKFYPSPTPAAILVLCGLFPGSWFGDPLMSCPQNDWHSSSSSAPHQLALITECMHCSLMVSCVQVPNPQMWNGGGVGVETGQASAPLWASAFPSLKEEDGARGQAAPPSPPWPCSVCPGGSDLQEKQVITCCPPTLSASSPGLCCQETHSHQPSAGGRSPWPPPPAHPLPLKGSIGANILNH